MSSYTAEHTTGVGTLRSGSVVGSKRYGSQDTQESIAVNKEGREDLGADASEFENVALGGDTDEHGLNPKWKNMEWYQAGFVMLAETISLGILALPSTLATVGLIPGVILIVGLGIITSYTGYVVGQINLAYPAVHNVADVIEILFASLGPKWKRFGYELGGVTLNLFLVFVMGSHILTWVICLDTLTGHATCNIVWGVVGLVLFWILDLPKTLKNMSYWSIASFGSVFVAVMVTMITVGINDNGSFGPNKYEMWPTDGVTLYSGFQAVTNIIFAYGGHACFFTFISEMKKPEDFPKALAILQVSEIIAYTVAAVIIYRFGGKDIKSPALGSAGPIVSKIAYGLAIPTIVIAGVIFGHVAAKYVFVRLYAKKKRPANTLPVWALIVGLFWVVAWIIAESVPNFNDLLGLLAALFISWFAFILEGVFWLFMNKGKYFSSWQKVLLTIINISCVIMGAAIAGIGMYSSGTSIANAKGGKAWSCGNELWTGST